MTTKKNSPKKKATRKSKQDLPIEKRICNAAFALANENGWDAVTLESLANELGMPYGDLVGICSSQNRLVTLLFNRVDQAMLSSVGKVDHSESVRDRLFDVLMARFDVLQGERNTYEGLIKSLGRQPDKFLCRVPHTLHAMALALIAAGVDAEGLSGMVRVKALAVTYGSVLRVWLKDDSADMAQTMSALDKGLARLESGARFLARKSKPQAHSGAETDD